jgi:membrane-associated protein
MSDFFSRLYFLLRNLGNDQAWRDLLACVGGPGALYVVLFAIIFAETGLVITPFLPGDSLLFALGAVGARDIGINLPAATLLVIAASILGDAANYWIGNKLGPAVFTKEDSWLLNKKHLMRAHEFYEKYGAKTIILARFVPIVRTFAPFVAGIGKMSYPKFFLYNAVGGAAWVLVCVTAGYLFGQTKFVKDHFELVIVAIVVISVMPMVIEYLRASAAAKSTARRPCARIEEPSQRR